MLMRIWWFEETGGGFFKGAPTKTAKTGIVFCGDYDCVMVREDNGAINAVNIDDITKSEWVEKP